MTYPLATLRTFEAAARRLSFTLAAEELHLTQSAVSQQIKQLEGRLGFTVFRRLTRRLELTDQGRQLYEAARRALHDLDLTVEVLRNESSQGSVTISSGSTFAANWLIPRMGALRDAHPEIELRILPTDGPVDLRAEPSIDLAVRFYYDFDDDGMVMERLGEDQVFVVASPALLGEATLRRIEDLADFPLLHNEVSDNEPGSSGDWRNWLAALGRVRALDTAAGPRLARSDLVVRAALHGQGLALVWETMVLQELADGRLVKVFDGAFETTRSYVAWCTPQAYGKPKVRAVMDWLKQEASA